MVIDLKMVTREFLNLADLFKVQTFCVHELTEVVIVDKYEDFIFAAF